MLILMQFQVMENKQQLRAYNFSFSSLENIIVFLLQAKHTKRWVFKVTEYKWQSSGQM